MVPYGFCCQFENINANIQVFKDVTKVKVECLKSLVFKVFFFFFPLWKIE